eukprot:TRINITY_DN7538_c0_g8_i3.p1 TRINITY_DN7538_c0_g8~~TRINITY_DN7538_c0_g8_i3.p1  ORF type:complete len:676 (+),score=99.63 TRINITY_DN7538_c0_g8_i3:120-2147(+)
MTSCALLGFVVLLCGRLRTASGSQASDNHSTTVAWKCGGPGWARVLKAIEQLTNADGSGSATKCLTSREKECTGSNRLLAYTSLAELPYCPIGIACARLAHIVLTLERDWHGDFMKTVAWPLALLQQPFDDELALITDVEASLTRAAGSYWYKWFFTLLAILSNQLCPDPLDDSEGHRRGAVDYKKYCGARPWEIGCDRPHLPSCNDAVKWRRDKRQVVDACWGRDDPTELARCAAEALPAEKPTSLLEFLVPRQQDLWVAMGNVLASQYTHRLQRQYSSVRKLPEATQAVSEIACADAIPKTEYLPLALCGGPRDRETEGDGWAPAAGYIARHEVLPGRLDVSIVGAAARELQGCGIEVEFQMFVNTPQAPPGLDDFCQGMACREQCQTWEAANFLRFDCVVPGVAASPGSSTAEYRVRASVVSGLHMEPTLHTRLGCRFPAKVLPSWLLAAAQGEQLNSSSAVERPMKPWSVELRELNGVFKEDMQLWMCPYKRQRRDHRQVAVCARPLVGARQHLRLLNDWLGYNHLIGVDHFFLYDADGSLEELLPELTTDAVTYVKKLPRRLGERPSGLYDSFWKRVGGNGCLETLQLNHCLSLTKSAGYKWALILKGIDKFLHSDVDHGPFMLRRFMNSMRKLPAGFAIHRRDCGGVEPEKITEEASMFLCWRLSAAKA